MEDSTKVIPRPKPGLNDYPGEGIEQVYLYPNPDEDYDLVFCREALDEVSQRLGGTPKHFKVPLGGKDHTIPSLADDVTIYVDNDPRNCLEMRETRFLSRVLAADVKRLLIVGPEGKRLLVHILNPEDYD